ncbi:MAG: ABC transporter ATP-binding protein [Gammaproteobacteria bacterium]|nr:ABC transporter ATP-binding protein [Gammaproteobacteria bacterium]
MLNSLLRLKPFVRPYRLRLASGIASFGFARVFEALVPFFLATGIDKVAGGDGDVTNQVFGIVAAVAGRYVFVTYARYSVRSVGMRVAFDLRGALYDALQKQGSGFFSTHTIGDMMTRAVADISLVQRLISMGSILLIILVYASIVGFGFMLYYSPALTLLLLPPLPVVYYYARHASRQMGVASKDMQDRLSDLGAQVQENLSGIRTIQAMAQEDNEIARFARTSQAYADAFYRQARINSLMMAWMPSLAALCSITIVGFGGYLVLSGEMSPGALVAFLMYVNMVVQPFRVAGFMVNLFQRAAVASDRLFEVLSLEPEIEDLPGADAPARVRGVLETRNLSFRYGDGLPLALDGISLSIGRGESIAVMGRVGSGKTTLLRQFVRLLDPPPGQVFLDGQDIRDYPLAQLRAQTALVPQVTFLFSETLRDNLTYDDPGREIDSIWAAAEAADLKETIEGFPDGMDTVVGERGVTLSGGQVQRATLARGLIRDAPVLLLDDCFSSVDTETEERILKDLRRLRRGKTTVVVSHRVSTARHCDRILVLDAGRIIESGTHEELIRQDGLYVEFERIQREGAGESDYRGAASPLAFAERAVE